MPIFSTKRYDQILTQMLAKLVSRTKLSDISDSSVFKHLLASVARAIDELYYNASLLRDLFSLDRATGEDLDERAAEILPGSITRNASVKATGNVVFSRQGTTGTVTIPIGTKVQTAGGEAYTTTSVGSLTPASPEQIGGHGVGRDSNLTSIVADVGGTDGNVAANTIIKFVSKPAGVDEVTNPAVTSNGSDEESDDAFRSRLKQFVAGLARSTIDAIESGVLGVQDPDSGQTILFAKAVEDIVDRGEVILYIDDGTGSAESTAETQGTALAGAYQWAGGVADPTTVLTDDTSDVVMGDFIGLENDGQFFEISAINPGVSVDVANPGGLTLPTDAGVGTTYKNPETMTEGLGGGGGDAAVGGEEDLYLNHIPIKDTVAKYVVSSTRGLLADGTDYLYNQADGHVVFLVPLVADEYVFAVYTYYTGLIALGQLIVDGDPDDRTTYPGLRAAGVRVIVQTPTVLIQNITVNVTVEEGYDNESVEDVVVEAIKEYVNGLGISGDVLRAELIARIMAVAGVFNVSLTLPAADVIILDDQMARTTDVNITIN
jgi:uncharacterized phage protein gp47/JayE